MDSAIAIALPFFLLLFSFQFPTFSASASDHLPVFFNFGDSNSDTGGYSATFRRLPSPYGHTFFRRRSGRYSDGRLIIDFITEKLGIPYLRAYLDSIAPDFKHGANFAASGATIQPATGQLLDLTYNPVTLNIQFVEFQQFKDRTIELFHQDRNLWEKSSLPMPEDFDKALYMLDFGQNDVDFLLKTMEDEQKMFAFIPNLINRFALAIKELYQEGARKFLIHNTGPIGCLPINVMTYPPKPENKDQIGCIKSYNSVAQEFNNKLDQMVAELRTELPDALLVLVDMYSAKYSLISQAQKHGFEDPLGCCCGHFGDYIVNCGSTTRLANGTEIFGASCSDPSKHVGWDGIHYTDNANRLIASGVIDGSFSDPPLPITEVCRDRIRKKFTL